MSASITPLRALPARPSDLARIAHEQATDYGRKAEEAAHANGIAWADALLDLARVPTVPAARRDRYQRLGELIARELRDTAFMRMRNPQ